MKTPLIIFSSMVWLAAFAEPMAEDCKHSDDGFQCVKFLRNYDADTITFEINGVHKLLGQKIPIRVRGVDTPELRTKDKCEKAKGYEARDLVRARIEKAKRIDLTQCSRGKYFRLVCSVMIDGKDLSEELLVRQLAYKYDGGTKQNVDWCRTKRKPASSK